MKNLEITFFNDWHNGDIHMSRNYVKDIINIAGPQHKYFYYHTNDVSLLDDIKNLTSTNIKPPNSDVYIDTWAGQDISKGMPFNGCNFISYYEIMMRVYDRIGLLNFIKPMMDYVPTIDYSHFDIQNIDSYFDNNKNKFVLICNNEVKSDQAPQFSLDFLIEFLAKEFDYKFICSNETELTKKYENVIYANDIINKKNKTNLNEISYLSTKCCCVIGRSSGPYTFSVTKENIINKKFICFCTRQYNSWYHSESDVDYPIWSNDYSPENMIDLVKKTIQNL